MNVPIRIYFDNQTGSVIKKTGGYSDSGLTYVNPIDYEISLYSALSERNRETFDVIELPFGAYAQDFAESNGYRVNPETKTLEFSYPDPNQPEAPPVYQKPLSEQIEEAKRHSTLVSNDLQAFMDFYFENGGM